jgi:hypothetical protein
MSINYSVEETVKKIAEKDSCAKRISYLAPNTTFKTVGADSLDISADYWQPSG